MPTYSYRCRDCDVAFDIQQSFDEDSLTVCPRCDGTLRKLFNTVGVVFKGSGFYRTDSRASGDSGSVGKGSAGSSSGSGSSGSGSSGSGSSDSSSSTSGSSGSGSGSGSGASTGSGSSSGSSTSSS
ncbi:FmdB family zinc ribbon protein [Dietzia maris]|uniref:FmdB family zinc ribbon protein n=1 Tax=Dietzia maris TaxID=37915 RepID=UPI0037CAF5CE